MATATDAAIASLKGYKPVDTATATTQAEQKYGVGESRTRLSALKGIVDNLTSSVEAVDPSVTGRTSGTFTTEGQRQALVSKEKAPILTNLSKQQTAYGTEQGNLNTAQSLASQMASAVLSDDKAKYNRLLDQYNAAAAQDTATENKRQYETTLAEQKRQANMSYAEKATTSKTSAIQSLNEDIASNIADFRNKPDGWTEKTLIPELIKAYPELTTKQITDYVYQLRKQYE
jgi:hypothetical protein